MNATFVADSHQDPLVEMVGHGFNACTKNDFIMAAKTDKLALGYNCEN